MSSNFLNPVIKLSVLFTICLVIVSCSNDKGKQSNKQEVKKTEKVKVEQKKEVSMKPEQIAKAKEIIAGLNGDEFEAVDVKSIYKYNCLACHGFKGDAMVNGAPDLTKSTVGFEEAIAQVFYGKGLMQPFDGILTELEIAAVTNYVQNFRHAK